MKTALFIILQLASSGSDAYFTHRNAMTPRFHEYNPIARPFVGSTRGTVIYFGGGAALKIGAVCLLRKRGHQRFADALALAGIADNAGAAIFSATHLNAIH